MTRSAVFNRIALAVMLSVGLTACVTDEQYGAPITSLDQMSAAQTGPAVGSPTNLKSPPLSSSAFASADTQSPAQTSSSGAVDTSNTAVSEGVSDMPSDTDTVPALEVKPTWKATPPAAPNPQTVQPTQASPAHAYSEAPAEPEKANITHAKVHHAEVHRNKPKATAAPTPTVPAQSVPVQAAADASSAPVSAPATAPASSGMWHMPMAGKVVHGFDSQKSTLSAGIDIAAHAGTPVESAAGGTVAYSGPDTNNQYSMVIIKHEEGRLSAYSPLSKVTVKEGDTVVQGEKLGVLAASVGHEGLLHFEVRQHGNPVDPMTLISE